MWESWVESIISFADFTWDSFFKEFIESINNNVMVSEDVLKAKLSRKDIFY